MVRMGRNEGLRHSLTHYVKLLEDAAWGRLAAGVGRISNPSGGSAPLGGRIGNPSYIRMAGHLQATYPRPCKMRLTIGVNRRATNPAPNDVMTNNKK